MNDSITYFLVVISFFILIDLIIGWRAGNEAKKQYENGYIDACKDFYQGKLKYDLVSNSDGTREWKKIK